MHKRVYNFSAGPATLPLPVLEQIQQEIYDWRGTGVSIMELGHRTEEFRTLLDEIEKNLRTLLKIPKNYHILYMHGGAQTQFSMIPFNLLGHHTSADYLETGTWSRKAIKEAKKYLEVNVVASSADKDHCDLISSDEWKCDPNAAYFYYTSNETIHGFEINQVPKRDNIPIIVDMTSSILANPMDVSQYGLIFASAQKNLGCAGITLVIIRDDLLDRADPKVPSVYHYSTQVETSSLYNTLPTFPCYVMGLVLEWLKAQGGVEEIAMINQRKAKKLYQFIDDHSDFYINKIVETYRSDMNIPFQLANEDLTSLFLKEAEQAGLKYLKGHREVGGIRASIYNAMPESGVDALVEFMKHFMDSHY